MSSHEDSTPSYIRFIVILIIIVIVLYIVIRLIVCFWIPILLILGISFLYSRLITKIYNKDLGKLVFVASVASLSGAFITGGIRGNFLFESVYISLSAWINLLIATAVEGLLVILVYARYVRRKLLEEVTRPAEEARPSAPQPAPQTLQAKEILVCRVESDRVYEYLVIEDFITGQILSRIKLKGYMLELPVIDLLRSHNIVPQGKKVTILDLEGFEITSKKVKDLLYKAT
ncbi:MAG: hypothetical protein DRJ63_06195 [Thermoprotei archaeon]|nr:MAG: hypothetical protein DRJ63_06195 [Thermoprotei archaeon]